MPELLTRHCQYLAVIIVEFNKAYNANVNSFNNVYIGSILNEHEVLKNWHSIYFAKTATKCISMLLVYVVSEMRVGDLRFTRKPLSVLFLNEYVNKFQGDEDIGRMDLLYVTK